MYMHVFCMASVLHHTTFLTTRLAFKLRGLRVVDTQLSYTIQVGYRVFKLCFIYLVTDNLVLKCHLVCSDGS